MKPITEHIIYKTLSDMISEQAPPAGGPALETDNAESDAEESPFTPAEKRFLGKFDAYGTKHMGIIYSVSDIGVREFITRSGKDFNLTPGILLQLLRDKIIKIVPYTGWGRNDDYTLELQLSLDDIKGFGAEDKAKAEKGSDASGAPASGGAPPPAPEVAWVMKYGDILSESAKVAKQLITEKKTKKSKTDDVVHIDKSRMLKKLPTQYVKHLEQLISNLSKTKYSVSEKQRIIADIIDNLAVNFKLSDKHIAKSFDFHKNQKRLQKIIDNK
jgi:hypothetical protein